MAKTARREKGSGSIYKRGTSYIAQVQDGFHENGKPKYRQVRCKTQSEAVRALNEFNALLVSGKSIPERRGITLAAWIEEWLEDHVKPNREIKTYQFYRLMCDKKITPYLGRLELQRVSPTDISRMFRSLEADGASPNTILAVRRTLRSAYGFALKYGVAQDNPVARTFAPKVRRSQKFYFDPKQVKALMEALVGSPIDRLVRFTLATGMRVGEVTGLTWDGVDLENQSVLVSNQLQRVGKELILKPLKTDKSLRSMPLVGHSLDVILAERERQEEEGYENPLNLVFLNAWGRPFDPKYVNKALHEVLDAAGLPRTGMHSLRHSAATFMLMAGLNLHQVSRYLGHSQIALTSNLYGHVLDGPMREAAQRLQDAYSAEPKKKATSVRGRRNQ